MLWNTCGFDNAGTCAAEVANPGTTYPRALAIAIILVVLTYAGPTLVGIYFIPDIEDWEVRLCPTMFCANQLHFHRVGSLSAF